MEINENEQTMADILEQREEALIARDRAKRMREERQHADDGTIMNIQFKQGEEDYIEMQDVFNKIGYDALFMDHYQLHDVSKFSPIKWKEFITDPRVSAFISEELDLLKKAKVAKMLRNADSNKNVGQAQLLNTLLNQTKSGDRKEGPAFVYCYVPLNDNEIHAENVQVIEDDNSPKSIAYKE